MPKKIVLIEKWVLKYADIKKIDDEIMVQLFRDDALNPSTIKAELIKHDAKFLQENSNLTKTQVKKWLANEYAVTQSHVETILYNKNNYSEKQYHCRQCGVEISRYKDKKNEGLCDLCLIKNEAENL